MELERKYLIQHYPFCNLFILYLVRLTRFPSFIRQNKCQGMFLYRMSASNFSLLQKPGVNIFRTYCLPRHLSTRQRTAPHLFSLLFLRSFSFPFLAKLFVVDNQLTEYLVKSLSASIVTGRI